MHDEQESHEHPLPAELAALERHLAALTPAAPRVDRDRLMFAAGRASAMAGGSPSVARPQPPTVWLWPAATALMTAATILLATMLVWQRDEAEPLASNPQAVDVALTQGIGALDREFRAVNGAASELPPPATARQLLEELLPTPNQTST